MRWFNKPRISDYLRITIGTDEQTDALIDVLRELTLEAAWEKKERVQNFGWVDE